MDRVLILRARLVQEAALPALDPASLNATVAIALEAAITS